MSMVTMPRLAGSTLVLWACVFAVFVTVVDGDAFHPVRYGTEEEFYRANTHDRTHDVAEMEKKISEIRQRRKFQPWNVTNPVVAELIKIKRPNILFILADDLGYGDLSVEPFTTAHDKNLWPCTEGGILTPNLEQMAAEGAILTNFHAAAPVCSPSRAAIMTGLYSWRTNAMNAFEVSKEDITQLNGYLPQIPTVAEYLREEAGYFTAHSGKWHIGGMREENRRARANGDDCTVPGPNQHGFEEFISALDGPESPRYSFLNRRPGGLHIIGHRHRIKNDVPMPILEKDGFVLSDYEADDAIQLMQHAKTHYPGQPWFIQVWFNAPHGPWERLAPGEAVYNAKYGKQPQDWERTTCRGGRGNMDPLFNNRWYYKTMVSAMDRSIGTLFAALKDNGLDENTLVVFTSDNGAEWEAGTGGDFKEGKRSLLEGGIRVPLVARWKGVIPANSYSSHFTAHTDLLPTFLDAAKVDSRGKSKVFDGVSLLPFLKHAHPKPAVGALHDYRHLPDDGQANLHEKEMKKIYFPSVSHGATNSNHSLDDLTGLAPNSRVHLWHKATDPFRRDARRQSGGTYEHIKVLASNDGCIDRVFDLRYDPREDVNLVSGAVQGRCGLHFNSVTVPTLHTALSTHWAAQHCKHARESDDKCHGKYHAHLVKKVGIVLAKLIPFYNHGKAGWQNYMDKDSRNAVCSIPTASEAKAMVWHSDGAPCRNTKFGCTEPEFPFTHSPF